MFDKVKKNIWGWVLALSLILLLSTIVLPLGYRLAFASMTVKAKEMGVDILTISGQEWVKHQLLWDSIVEIPSTIILILYIIQIFLLLLVDKNHPYKKSSGADGFPLWPPLKRIMLYVVPILYLAITYYAFFHKKEVLLDSQLVCLITTGLLVALALVANTKWFFSVVRKRFF